MRVWNTRRIEFICMVIIAGMLAALFLFKSPLHPWICSDTGTDSSVFRTIAFMMSKGFMPYRDSFDHKGPLLYILNWFGNDFLACGGGIWTLECKRLNSG